MTHENRSSGKILDEFLRRISKPSLAELDSSRRRLRERLDLTGDRIARVSQSPARSVRLGVVVASILFMAVAGVLTYSLLRRSERAIAQSVDGALYRVSDGETRMIPKGGEIDPNDRIRANGDGVIALSDGSRVEMRARSELSLDQASDGVRIRLSMGGVIVSAAKQGSGHLYVETKDITVSVVGTVFLVNAEQEGSHVAVIEGEVSIQQGGTKKKLRPGEQVATSPWMEPRPVKEEIAWSRDAEEHLAMLLQSAPPPLVSAPQSPVDTREAFEVASIKPSTAPASAGRGGGPADPRMLQCGGAPQVSPGSFAISNATAYRLIGLAFGVKNCPLAIDTERISGGPEWLRASWFDIRAVVPEGTPVYTGPQLFFGEAPKLQMMIQTLLADRFKLELRREMREVPAYSLVVVKPGRIKPSEDQNSLVRRSLTSPGGLEATSIPMTVLASWFENAMGRPVLDKTDLKGLFDISPFDKNASGDLDMPEIARQVLDQLGLKLEPARATLEFLTVAHIEKPTPN